MLTLLLTLLLLLRQVFMISYMIDGQGYLIINREVVSEDIADFEYTPKPEFKGPFKVFNERDERSLMRRWFDHMRALRPGIYVTYNGDFFDWPFLADRAEKLGMSLYDEQSVRVDRTGAAAEARSRAVLHLDAFAWVRRDSYLPQGSQGLKAVTRAKSTDADKVVAELEKMKNEATLFGPRTFTSEIHHQNSGRYLIVDIEQGKPKVTDNWTISEPIPLAALLKN